jgi:hypothetical protein
VSLALHLPVLQVVLPLISAPLAVLLRHGGLAFAIVTAAAWAAFACSIALWLQVGHAEGGVISYAIGNWPPPWGIEYRVDRLASFVLLLVSGMAALVLPWSRASIEREIPRDLHYLYYAMFGLCLTGLLGITITGRCLQHLRLPRNLLAVELCADSAGARPPRAHRRLPVPDHGQHRRHLHRHRHRLPLPDDRHAQPRRHGVAHPRG